MNLIQEIINDLTSASTSITEALFKTKVLASRTKNHDLIVWVDRELEGYKDLYAEQLPNYRIVKPTLLCTIRQGMALEENIPIVSSPKISTV